MAYEEEKNCATCGEKFTARSHNQKYCSDSCKGKYGRTCPQCGTEFRTSKHTKKLCSQECSDLYRRNRTVLECEHCGDEFEVASSREDEATYCSSECHDEARRKYQVCEQCGERFQGLDRRKYCSMECSSESRTRDDRVCERCGEEYAPVYPDQRYCSLSCSTSARYSDLEVETECDVCGDTVLRREWEMQQEYDSVYCSDECMAEGFRTSKKVPCCHCGEVVEKLQSELEAADEHFCSPECASKGKQTEWSTAECGWCGEQAEYLESQRTGEDIYCSRECSARDQAKPVVNGKAQCASCERWLPLEEFPSGKTFHGIGSNCRTCERDRLHLIREQRRAAKEEGERLTKQDYANKRSEQDGRCFYCGVEMIPYQRDDDGSPHPHSETLDHMIPLCRGGHHTDENTVLACVSCNAKKRDRTPEEFRKSE